MAGKRMKVLLTSVGSLVGQNILDVLEYPGFSRRSLMRVVGTNSVPDAACNFRCDRCYLLPLTATAEYSARMREILLEESPDLIQALDLFLFHLRAMDFDIAKDRIRTLNSVKRSKRSIENNQGNHFGWSEEKYLSNFFYITSV